MTIIISDLRKPGVHYDSSSLAILGKDIAQTVSNKSNKRYIATSDVEGRRIVIRLRVFDDAKGRYIMTTRDEQVQLAGQIAQFLQAHNVSSEVRVQ